MNLFVSSTPDTDTGRRSNGPKPVSIGIDVIHKSRPKTDDFKNKIWATPSTGGCTFLCRLPQTQTWERSIGTKPVRLESM